MDQAKATGSPETPRSTMRSDRLLTHRSIPIAVLVLTLHLILLTTALVHKSYLTDDSIQYLTLSENLTQHGTFSQSYLAPYVPDLQRTPGYPVFLLLCGNSIPLVLILQHLMVILSGFLLFRMMRLFFGLRTARVGAWIWLLQPYPILMASMVLSEVPFILVFLLGMYGVLMHLQESKLAPLSWGISGLVVAVYIRPVALPVLVLLLLALVVKAVRSQVIESRRKKLQGSRSVGKGSQAKSRQRPWFSLAIFLVLVPLLLSPWLIRNHAISGKWMVSSMGDMGMLHGRLGGLEAFRQGDGVGETQLFRLGDSLAVQQDGLQNYRSYYSEKQSHETELYRSGAASITIGYFLNHPVDGILFQGQSLLAMLKGVGFGWSRQITGSTNAAYLLSGLQALANLAMYIGMLLALLRIRRWPAHFWFIFLSVVTILLVSNAAWADGRYRMVVDPLIIIASGFLWSVYPREDS